MEVNTMNFRERAEKLVSQMTLEEKVARYDYDYANRLIAEMKFEQLEMYTMNLIMGLV